jgi:hypothetical protein
MAKAIHDLNAIATLRALTIDRLRCLFEAEGTLTAERIQQVVFEADNTDLQTFISFMLAALSCNEIDDVDQATLQLIQDAWNYFPHRCLDGKCPAELMARSIADH